ncbi:MULTISPECIES: GTPase [unclassified Campylobacter]|uniref:GTPase n=1 Tax=unclassified Campylobacter TaxID=2593542 RepID=UPI0022E9CDC3|nr:MULTISPECIES: GTPase [unclassified Campylobacter]MDA3056190.1 50S ribosome-binding GTPase [Campylobacter sp. CN_NA1]MDA3065335.1 50S ribosome-binding GTPase [Campylobacter sp. CN_NE4]MDA3068161.1 50S ribosome-binding GTPase [Campylobacter sp. CN_NE3]MDA3079618.1 50S ribosome-binding GTPase [Campylobacter sp. CS_NA2]MDA3080950.1 50S ribosome-binding GTPase [Campylobacter sp. CS_NA1]
MSIDEIRELVEALKFSQNIKPNVLCIGIYNSGKSSLLNALIDDFENETFEVADKRETPEIKSVEYGGIIYIDTPGLNATPDDDEKALGGEFMSDVNIFLHSLSGGELKKDEIGYLHSLINELNNAKSFFDKTIFVINHIEDKSDEDIKRGMEKIKEQIQNEFSASVKVLSIKTPSYIKGKNENKNLLVQNSGINELKEQINKMCRPDKIYKNRNARLEKAVKMLILSLQEKIEENNKAVQNIKEKEEQIKEKVAEANKTIKNMKARLR